MITETSPTSKAEAGRDCDDVSVLITTHNRPQGLDRAIASVRQSSPKEIVVFDDASDEPAHVAGDDVRVVRSQTNVLLTSARNLVAREAGGEYLFFMDDDCTVEPEAVGRLRAAFDDDDDLGMAGPVIVFAKDPDSVWCAGVERNPWTGKTTFTGFGKPSRSIPRVPYETLDFPSAFMVKRTAFEEVRGFDAERFPFHMSEADFGDKIRSSGSNVKVVPSARVRHDIAADDSLFRRLHISGRERAFSVAHDRVLYIRRSPIRSLQKLTQMVMWLCVLMPVYMAAAAIDTTHPVKSRMANVGAVLRGTFAGLSRS